MNTCRVFIAGRVNGGAHTRRCCAHRYLSLLLSAQRNCTWLLIVRRQSALTITGSGHYRLVVVWRRASQRTSETPVRVAGVRARAPPSSSSSTPLSGSRPIARCVCRLNVTALDARRRNASRQTSETIDLQSDLLAERASELPRSARLCPAVPEQSVSR